MSEQSDNLARVRSRIASCVLTFCASRLLLCPTFRMAQLQEYVAAEVSSAPASPDRILRQLRKEGLLDYVVVDRAGSLYRILSVKERPT